jgi:hypothetical protein
MRALPRLGLAVAAIAACGKGDGVTKDTPRAPEKHDAAVAAVDWVACDAALAGAPALADTARAAAIIAGCPVCGDWRPLLDWGKRHEDGGPTRSEIEAAMLSCDGYCGGESKDRFLGTLDNARGTNVPTPWRWLGRSCKDKVSAVPDERFSSPQLFALDRIARAATAHGDAAKLAAIHLVLPAVSITGSGVALPTASHLAPSLPVVQVTITTTEVTTGPLPSATLTDHGLAVDLGSAAYPGAAVADAKTLPAGPYAVLAPHAMPAARVVDALAAAPSGGRLAALPPDTAKSWQVPGVIPVDLDFHPTIKAGLPVIHLGDPLPAPGGTLAFAVRPADTVEQLAAALDAAAAAGWAQAAVVRDKAP